MADLISVRQKEALGLGHAVLQAKDAVGDEPFAVVLPDDVILADEPCLLQMRRVFEETGRPVVALMEVSAEETSRYGIVAGNMLGNRRFHITDMVEKPKVKPPSHYAIIGRYILPPDIFPLLEKTERGAGGEIQLTDALRELVRTGDFYGYVFEGKRYDAGEKLGYLKATVDYALRHPALGDEFRAYLEALIGEDQPQPHGQTTSTSSTRRGRPRPGRRMRADRKPHHLPAQRPALAILISHDEYLALRETIDIADDAPLRAAIDEAEAEVERGAMVAVEDLLRVTNGPRGRGDGDGSPLCELA